MTRPPGLIVLGKPSWKREHPLIILGTNMKVSSKTENHTEKELSEVSKTVNTNIWVNGKTADHTEKAPPPTPMGPNTWVNG